MHYLVNIDGTDLWYLHTNLGQAKARITRAGNKWVIGQGYTNTSIPGTIYTIEPSGIPHGFHLVPVDLTVPTLTAAQKKKIKAAEEKDEVEFWETKKQESLQALLDLPSLLDSFHLPGRE
jgi:hypothetical protein